MTTPPYRDHILATMPDGLEKDVYCIVRDYVGKDNAITLESLTMTQFGSEAMIIVIEKGKPTRKVSETKLRQVREAIETLREVRGVPVCSNSGKAGRYLPKDRAELDEFIAEHRSRAKRETEAADKLERAARNWNYAAPIEHVPTSFEAVQAELFPAKRVEYV